MLAGILLLGVLWLVVSNFTSLIGGELLTAVLLLAVVPVGFFVGYLTERHAKDPFTGA